MTNPPRRQRPEAAGTLPILRPLLAASTVLGLLLAAGCGGGDEQAVAPPPPPPPQAPVMPTRPKVTSVADLMAQLAIDDRIYMQDAAAPASTEERQAVLEFFDAFVRGRDGQLRPMLSETDQPLLELMVDLGRFTEVAEAIEEVEVVAGSSPDGRPAVLGMYVRDGVDEYQLWYFEIDAGLARFESAPTPPGIVARLSGPIDGYIERWHEILDEEMRLASQPDEEIRLDVNLDEESESDGEGGSPSMSPGAAPSPGGGSPIRRHRPGSPRRPPGIPG